MRVIHALDSSCSAAFEVVSTAFLLVLGSFLIASFDYWVSRTPSQMGNFRVLLKSFKKCR